MRIKKSINNPVKNVSAFEVELVPFEDFEDFVKTGNIAYKLLFPQLDGKILVNMWAGPVQPNTPKHYKVTIQVPAFLDKFLDKICLDWGERVFSTPFSFNVTRKHVCALPVEPLISFAIGVDFVQKDKIIFFQLKLKNSALNLHTTSTITSNNNEEGHKFKNLLSIREKKFLQEYSLGRMLQSEVNLRDFTIMAGRKEIRVHKVVLASQSPVFAQMLSVPMDEARNSLLKITDIQENCVRIAIDFMYTGQIEDLEQVDMFIDEILMGLYTFAQKYELVHLKWAVFEKCQTYIDYFDGPVEKHKFIQIVALHETDMDDLNSFLSIFGPYSIKE